MKDTLVIATLLIGSYLYRTTDGFPTRNNQNIYPGNYLKAPAIQNYPLPAIFSTGSSDLSPSHHAEVLKDFLSLFCGSVAGVVSFCSTTLGDLFTLLNKSTHHYLKNCTATLALTVLSSIFLLYLKSALNIFSSVGFT